MHKAAPVILSVSLFGLSTALAADAPISNPQAEENIQVTTTRIPEDPDNLATVVTVLDGNMLLQRGMTDLRSALGVVAGVDIAPGGDSGPASAIPEMWGLREFDAFLLVVDGVPWGGAFNPDIATLSLEDVERIEIVRGPAPVMYGATSFVGVIQVIHNHAGGGNANGRVTVGDHSSFGISGGADLGSHGGQSSRIAVDFTQRGYPDERTSWERANIIWRNRFEAGGGAFRFDVNLSWVNQEPASPTPLVGTGLSPLVDPDANVNPLNSHVNPNRYAFSLGYDHPAGYGEWSVTAAYGYAHTESLRGFLDEDPTFPDTAAHGIRQDIAQDDLYLDGHLNFTKMKDFQIVAGVDSLLGRGRMHGGDFDYDVAPDGSDAPDGGAIPSAADVNIHDSRVFSGLYGYVVWTPAKRWRIDFGARLNVTSETRDTHSVEFGPPPVEDIGHGSRSDTKGSGGVGVTFTAWQKDANDVKVFAGYRNTFKPAAIDFGLDAGAEILDPEKGQAYEVGARAGLFDGKLHLEVECFQMDLTGIVVAVEGAPATPGLENGGDQKLKGVDIEARGRISEGLWWRFAWSEHRATFEDFTEDFGAGPVQLAGNRLEMSPEHMGALGVIWAPQSGFTAHGEVRYTGDRFLDRENTVMAGSFTSFSAGIGWRMHHWELRLDGENLSDQREPVSESELGPEQYYLLPARQIWFSLAWNF